MALAPSQKSLKNWSAQKWRTKSGKKSSVTGERYLPESVIKRLSPQEYARSTAKKRKNRKRAKYSYSLCRNKKNQQHLTISISYCK